MMNEWNIREIMKMSGDPDPFQENEWRLRGFRMRNGWRFQQVSMVKNGNYENFHGN